MDWDKYTPAEQVVLTILVLLGHFGVLCLVSWLGMLLWNALVPYLVGLGTITFWQAMGIKLMVTMLFTRFRINFGKND